ncbi:MFS transporter [Verrucosispora sp. WMMA2044]|uniref:MFS transporter n=2 Tax=Verrucosispora sioxanthis TaxID=2499994 RepID=A0A6M1LA58_9ACTN|nr:MULTISPECIES: MFS transporter [Micromonospora]NEE66026.1 MFS transporter [Verrucosispora sioxanthis]NGM15136.1 MFS transporter [Verrucosispora sioxanthis]WBB50507.1 MFS transporter [Verrucosispora sp. WMMA2044]
MTSRPGMQRALIAAVQVLGLAVWFSASAVVPALRESWQISAAASVWLTASVQLGFVAGAVTSTVLNLADRIRPHLLMAGSATLAAACTGVFALTVDGLAGAIPLRFLTGVFLAGVYPVGMKLTGSWAPPARRGLAFGVMIGALTLGSALPHLIGGLGDLPWRGVMGTAAGCALLGAVLAVTLVREGPQFAPGTPPRPHPRYALAMFGQRGPRLVNLGYFGHMWELYALWTWLPSFLIAGTAARTGDGDADVSLLAFLAIGVAGVAGCLVGGWAADRFGRPRAAFTALVVSGACCLASPLFFTAPPGAVVLLGVVWGAAVIADSGVFSTALSEVADKRYVGTALTAQTAIGFALTVVTIQLVPVLADAVGWRWAFLLLAPGPAVGALAMRAFGRQPTRA